MAPLIAGAVIFVGVYGLLWWSRSGSPARSTRVPVNVERLRAPDPGLIAGSATCRECHPGISAQQSRAGHARTLRAAAARSLVRQLDGLSVADPERPGVDWKYSLRDGQFAVEQTAGGRSQVLPIEFAFGSGHHATTFVTLIDRDPKRPVALEHRLTYFAHSGTVGVTPGQTKDEKGAERMRVGNFLSPSETFRCFHCHTTIVSDDGPDVLEPATMIANVTCERCHGPGRPHVEAARRDGGLEELAMPFGPGRWTADEQMLLCGQCHRHPAQGNPFKIRRDNPEIVRYQPVGLMQSACYRKSRGQLSCTTCHNPHARTSPVDAMYETVCLNCHTSPPQTSCPVSPRNGCVACHMPRRDSGQNVLFTDHWIAVNKDLALQPAGAKPAERAPSER